MNTNRTYQKIPDAVLKAIDHVRQIHPEVDLVVFNLMGHWQLMTEGFKSPRFGKFDPKTGFYGGIDTEILTDASNAAYEDQGHPAVYQAYTSEEMVS